MPAAINMLGRKFGRLSVVSELAQNKHKKRVFLCACECGSEVAVVGADLRNGMTKSCGCLQREVVGKLNLKHGKGDTRNNPDPTYRTWLGMRNRCNNPKSPDYPLYGGRGIRVAAVWGDFEVFLKDMGRHPGPPYSIDRINSNGNYEPGNCRWATPAEQHANRRPHANQKPVVIGGVSYPSLRQAATALHVCRGKLSARLKELEHA